MKKYLIISLVILGFIGIGLAITIFLLSFLDVKPTIDAINKLLTQRLTRIVRIPEGIPPPARNYNETIYFWEMETLAGEVTGVRFKYTNGYGKDEELIQANLEIPENSDVSIFVKVLPAVIADEQSVAAALQNPNANYSENKEIGYQKINILVKPQSNQTVSINWEFRKPQDGDLALLYSKLAKYPPFLLKILYGLPHFTLGLLSQ